jgi:hypothetical protein
MLVETIGGFCAQKFYGIQIEGLIVVTVERFNVELLPNSNGILIFQWNSDMSPISRNDKRIACIK